MVPVSVKELSPEGQNKNLVIVAGKKVSKKATERNLLKRRIREIMRPYLERGDKNYKVFVKKEAVNLSFQELKEAMEAQIK